MKNKKVPNSTIPEHLIQQISQYTNTPWWNGEAYAGFMGYPQRIHSLEQNMRHQADVMEAIVEELRARKDFNLSDRLRNIMETMREVAR